MDLNVYQKLAMRTSTQDHDRALNGCLGLIGESGEIVDIVKKWLFQSGKDAPIPREKLVDECGDVLWYCAELATGLGMELNDCLDEENFERLKRLNKSLTDAAIRLNRFCAATYESHRGEDAMEKMFQQFNITRIIAHVRYILFSFAEHTLEDTMEYNIDKLKRRYPNGFEAERSLNRAE